MGIRAFLWGFGFFWGLGGLGDWSFLGYGPSYDIHNPRYRNVSFAWEGVVLMYKWVWEG